VFTGTAPMVDAMSSIMIGNKGAGGLGQGNGTVMGGKGTDGAACAVLNFSSAMETCTVQ